MSPCEGYCLARGWSDISPGRVDFSHRGDHHWQTTFLIGHGFHRKWGKKGSKLMRCKANFMPLLPITISRYTCYTCLLFHIAASRNYAHVMHCNRVLASGATKKDLLCIWLAYNYWCNSVRFLIVLYLWTLRTSTIQCIEFAAENCWIVCDCLCIALSITHEQCNWHDLQ